MNFTVRTAKGIDNLSEAKYVRQTVFIEEQDFVNEFDDIDNDAFHTVIFDEDKPIATGRLFCDEKGWHIGRVAVLKVYRKKSLGERIISELETKAKQIGADKISLSAQTQAAGFYQKLGYENLGDLHMDEHCPHVTMKKKL